MKDCSIDGCSKSHKARGLCSGHYTAWRRSWRKSEGRPMPTADYYTRKIRRKAVEYLGGECVECGYNGLALQFDHIDDGGRGESSRRGQTFYREIANGIRPDIQLLCANCNWEKELS